MRSNDDVSQYPTDCRWLQVEVQDLLNFTFGPKWQFFQLYRIPFVKIVRLMQDFCDETTISDLAKRHGLVHSDCSLPARRDRDFSPSTSFGTDCSPPKENVLVLKFLSRFSRLPELRQLVLVVAPDVVTVVLLVEAFARLLIQLKISHLLMNRKLRTPGQNVLFLAKAKNRSVTRLWRPKNFTYWEH